MEYHKRRFEDVSLLVFKDQNLMALMPANGDQDIVYSHQGLTYGGPIIKDDANTNDIKEVFDALIAFYREQGFKEIRFKNLPEFYGNHLQDDIKMHLVNDSAEVYRTDRVLAVDYSKPWSIHKTKLKHYRKNQDKGFEIKESNDFSLFWESVLIPRLYEKHKASPVHSLDEIMLLKSRFPKQIRQFNIYLNGEILAGITIFDKGSVVKSQYGATTTKGEKERALEFLFLYLIYKYNDEKKDYFSMGTVTEDNEWGYNKGLEKQKEELGCSLYFQEFYSLNIL